MDVVGYSIPALMNIEDNHRGKDEEVTEPVEETAMLRRPSTERRECAPLAVTLWEKCWVAKKYSAREINKPGLFLFLGM